MAKGTGKMAKGTGKMADRPVELSGRLSVLAGMVTVGNVVCDVGCDHGFLAIYLIQEGISPHVFAMDVRKGPLSGAQMHVEERGLEERIELRLSDGLSALKAGEAQTMVCAGMGGPLMMRLLTQHPDRTDSLQEFVLQPQSEIREFRVFLREAGFQIVGEELVKEEGKYYFPMKVIRGNEETGEGNWELFDRFGKGLLESRHPLLRDYLKAEEAKRTRICAGLETGDSVRRKQRKLELERELELVKEALAYYGEG